MLTLSKHAHYLWGIKLLRTNHFISMCILHGAFMNHAVTGAIYLAHYFCLGSSLLAKQVPNSHACLQAANETRFVGEKDVGCAMPLHSTTIGGDTYIISPYVGRDLAHWAQHQAPELWSDFITFIRIFCIDLCLAGATMAQKVSSEAYRMNDHSIFTSP